MSFYDDASWLLIPSGIKEDVVYAQKPTSGLGDLTFTRASDATYTDASGVVRRSPYNLFQQSEDLTNGWSVEAVTVSSNTTTAPNGTLTADTVQEVAVNDIHRIYRSAIAINSGFEHTFSFYVKKDTGRYVRLVLNNSSSASVWVAAQFDLDTETFTSGVGSGGGTFVSASITPDANGFYRITLSGSMVATTAFAFLALSNGASITSSDSRGCVSYAGNTGNRIFAWGAQLVEGTEALDYFPTTNRQDVPRIDFRNADGTLSSCGRLLLEPQRTNSIRNSSMVGAVAGTPGTLPTNWVAATSAGLTRTIVGVGTENGLPYIDLRFNGTANSTDVRTDLEAATATAAATGQTWTYTLYSKVISGSVPASTFVFFERNSLGTIVTSGSVSFSPTSTLTRFAGVRTLNGGATVAFVQPSLSLTLVNGQTYDFTIRIAAPQMELGGFVTTWVPTTTAAVTRLADAASKTGVSSLIGQTEGTMFLDLNLDTRQSFSYFLITPNLATPTSYIGIGILNNIIQLEVVNSGVQASITFTNTSAGRFKIAAAYKQNDFAFYVNGTLVGTDTSGTVPACSALNLFITGSNIQPLQYNQAALFPTRLTNATLAQLTTL